MVGFLDADGGWSRGLRITTAWERSVVAPGAETHLLVRVEAAASPPQGRRSPIDVAFVLDRSGSMRGEPLALAKQAVMQACRRLRPEDRVALALYSDETELALPLVPATPTAMAAIRAALVEAQAGGGTDLAAGWLAGCAQLTAPAGAEADRRVRRAVLLSDGHANVGLCDPGELIRRADSLRRRGVSTTTLGLGLGFDELLLSAMAEAGGGNFQFAAEPDQLRVFFDEEIRELARTVAARTTLRLDCPSGFYVDPLSALPTKRRGSVWTIDVGDVPAGARVDVVFQATAPDAHPGDRFPPLLTARWTTPGADRRTEAVTIEPLTIASRTVAARVIPNALVKERAALQRAASDRRRALELLRAGKASEARQAAHAACDRLFGLAPTEALAADLQLSLDLAQAAAQRTVDERLRKE
ncbi:MAG: VWA domain-containing protein, partial [Thermomicrobiales bacterium]|nr:VWA domain-containing protein [Thermomicrobiales bacterium]